jgi:hypothetical protein
LNRDSAQLEKLQVARFCGSAQNYLQRNNQPRGKGSNIPAANARTVTDLEQDALNRDFEQLSKLQQHVGGLRLRKLLPTARGGRTQSPRCVAGKMPGIGLQGSLESRLCTA